MNDWIHDFFNSPDSDPDFGLVPSPRLKRILLSLIGVGLSSPLKDLQDRGLRTKLVQARRELRKIHTREQKRLLVEAARIRAHADPSREVRMRARAIWAGPLLAEDRWRELCREELVSARGTRRRPPRILRRLYRGTLEDWPPAADLVRAAMQLGSEAQLEVELVRASFLAGFEPELIAKLGELWLGEDLSEGKRLVLIRSLAVLHESAGEMEKAVACWQIASGRAPDNLLAELSCFSLAIAAADEVAARAAARTLRRTLQKYELPQSELQRALRERAWIGRLDASPLTEEARALRLELLTSGEPWLCELCMELA